MTTPEAILYSACVIVAGALIAWFWYLCAKSEPSEGGNKYMKIVDTYRNRFKMEYKYNPKEDEE